MWWSKISNASNFVKDIIDVIRNNESVIINNSRIIPFFDDFIERIRNKLSKRNADKSVERFNADDTGSCEIAKYMIDTYCSGSVYFPKNNYTEINFLADSDGFQLKNSILIVSNIKPESEKEWIDFVSNYCKASCKMLSKAQFILCIDSNRDIKRAKQCSIFNFSDYISDYDYYVYCLLAIAENKKYNITIKQYVAEIASLLCKDNAELCWRLLENPDELYLNTYEYYNSISSKKLSQNEINQVLWTAQIKYVFPILEKYRCSIAEKYKTTLKQRLPFEVKYGDTVSEVYNLELSHILCINHDLNFLTKSEFDKLIQFKNIRNDLAHMKPTSALNIRETLNK